MNNYNYFFTPVGPQYKKKFARNVGITVLILFAFYGISNLVSSLADSASDISENHKPEASSQFKTDLPTEQLCQ
jgi:hypothetical protein